MAMLVSAVVLFLSQNEAMPLLMNLRFQKAVAKLGLPFTHKHQLDKMH